MFVGFDILALIFSFAYQRRVTVMGMTWLWLMPCTKQTMLAEFVTHAALTVKPSELLFFLSFFLCYFYTDLIYSVFNDVFIFRKRVTAVDGQYQIGIYATRPISYGEEITFDYNSVTEVWPFLGTFSAHYLDQLFCVIYFLIYNLFNCRVKKNMKLQYVSVEVKYVGAAISVWQVKKLFRMYELFFSLYFFSKS